MAAPNPLPLDLDVPQIAADRAQRYRDRGLWRPELVSALARRGRLLDPQRCAVVDGDRRLSHGELDLAVTCAASRLHELGVRSGDRVGVQLPNCLEYFVLTLALLELGAPPVLILPSFGEHELDRVVTAAEPVAMAVGAGGRRNPALAAARRLRERHGTPSLLLVPGGADGEEIDLTELCTPRSAVPPALPEPSVTPADAAVFLLSSGTTGPPKVIPRSHEGYGYMIRTATRVAGISAESVYLAVMPVEHGFVFNCPGVLGTLAAGGTVVLGTPADAHQAFELIEREGVTHCTLVPTLVLQWLAAAEESTRDLRSLRVLQVGGASLDAAPARRVRDELGAIPQQCYGMSEGLLNYTHLDDSEDRFAHTQGRPLSAEDEMSIVDDEGVPVPPGEPGELLTRGPYTVAGYYRDENATAEAFTPDGFYRTGDLVSADEAGYLMVRGRVRDAINRGGEKISPDELEGVTREHPAVRDCAVVSAPHELYGEIVCLYAVASDELGLGDVRRFLQQRGLARYKLPERLEIVNSLPFKGIGKVDKKALRADVRQRIAEEQ